MIFSIWQKYIWDFFFYLYLSTLGLRNGILYVLSVLGSAGLQGYVIKIL